MRSGHSFAFRATKHIAEFTLEKCLARYISDMKSQMIARAPFWLLIGAVLIAAIMPTNEAPTIFAYDKLNHILAFFVLSFLAKILWPRTKIEVIFGLLATFGGSIEILQMGLGLGRDADWMDFAANLFAITIGLLAAHSIIRLASKVATAKN